MTRNLADVYAWINQHADDSIAELQRLLRQPSVAAQDHGMKETAAMVEGMLADIGMQPRQIQTAGFTVVYGE